MEQSIRSKIFIWLIKNRHLFKMKMKAENEQRISMPKAAFSISPVTDSRCLADSFNYNAKNDISPLFPEAKNATAEICEFAKSHIIAGDESLKRLDANGKEFMY